ncbi:MAG: 30S ribosomal protein S12 methylthiotransferase RimO [Myxococcota bacterium]
MSPRATSPRSSARTSAPAAARVAFASLGCPKALVDSERILTRLRAEGYEIAPTYEGADVVVVNTCGFLDSARAESLEAIGEALAENGRVVVTGCLGVDRETIRAAHPNVLAITGPQQTDAVLDAVHDAVPPPHAAFLDLAPGRGVRLTPPHYAYLKVSEGCNHRCSFCIIPQLRGRLASRPLGDVMREAEALLEGGVQELLVISQDTSAYGLDLGYASSEWRGVARPARFLELARALAELGDQGLWVRLHYVYPYPHVDEVVALMAEGRLLPYLDVPFQHASPRILEAMKRPAHDAKTLARIRAWRAECPDLVLRSTFIVGFPGETEDDFAHLLDWLGEARLDRVGCFRYEPVQGAAANALGDPVPDEVKEERWHRFMQAQQAISAELLAKRVGTEIEVIVDEVTDEGVVARSRGDAPEIDGNVYLEPGFDLAPGDRLPVVVDAADEVDLWASPIPA